MYKFAPGVNNRKTLKEGKEKNGENAEFAKIQHGNYILRKFVFSPNKRPKFP